MKNSKNRIILITIFILLAALLRLIPHPPNFVPITAIAIFAGSKFNSIKNALSFPIIIMLLSDIFIGFYTISLFVYLAFIIITIYNFLSKKYNLINVFFSSLLFFIISNFGVWILGGYGYTIEGLLLCYTMAIPFFVNSIVGDLFYSIILYFGFKKAEERLLSISKN
jgi:hypothetical protein